MYYLQDSRTFIGNSPLWWCKNGAGYTCDIDNAELFNEIDAMKHFEQRNTDIPWKKEDVEAAIKRIVDSQYLKKNNEDGFYTKLENIQNQKKKEALDKENYQKNQNYKKIELPIILENIDFIEINDFIEFSIILDDVKNKLEWCEYYYPTAYNKSSKEIFNDLIDYKLIFKCEECGKYFNSNDKDEIYTNLCTFCGEEKYLQLES